MVAAKALSSHSSTQGAPEQPLQSDFPKQIRLHPPIQPNIAFNIHPQHHSSVHHPESSAQAALSAARVAAAAVTVKPELHPTVSLLDHTSIPVSHHHIPLIRPQHHISTNPLPHPSQLHTTHLLHVPNHQSPFPQKMDIHDASGALLHQLAVSGEPDSVQQQSQQPEHAPQNQHLIQNHHPSQQTPQDPVQVATAEVAQQQQQSQQPPPPQQQPSASVLKPVPQTAPPAISSPMSNQRKPSRMPGTKQCPSCQNTIAAALAKCPKCPHVFREKKEKVKRSGKRGKKNCPKCTFENPSACSSCKNCKYVFRLKLMDKYKQMRPRQTSDTAAAAAAAAAHAAANMTGQHAGVTAVSTVPMQAGVASYPNAVAQPGHPAHAAVSVMPPLGQHPMSAYPHPHNVHATGVPQMHTMPHNTMPHHQTHPQL